ncbi:MAG: nucleotidyltransferase family protein [Gammaproteobacteria bacterium]
MDRSIPRDRAASERVRRLVDEIAREVHARLGSRAKVIWFGSWVSGKARVNSDIDIAIEVPEGLSMADYAALWDWVDELPTLYTIDLVNLSEVGPQFRREILEGGRVI